MIETLLPQIQKLVSDKTIQTLKKEGPVVVIKGLYNLLPGAIRFMIKEETFTNFCLSHQEKVFGTVQPTKQGAKKTAKKAVAKKTVKKTAKKKASK